MDTTAIIQFIGIVLFSAQVPNDPGVHAILPRIEHAEHSGHINNGYLQTSTGVSEDSVEEHVAVIMFRDADVLSRSGVWKNKSKMKNGWQYVQLDGEQVQFLTNTANAAPRIPSTLPRASVPSTSCETIAGTTARLKQDFQGPNYKGAVGVFDIPFGTLDTCAANTPNEFDRIDTALLLKTEGVLVIAARKVTEIKAKTITLDGDAVVYVANIPPYYLLEGEPPTRTGPEHWEAYTAMLDTPCPGKPEQPRATKACDLSAINTAWKIAQKAPPEDSIQIIDSGCSNTQWP